MEYIIVPINSYMVQSPKYITQLALPVSLTLHYVCRYLMMSAQAAIDGFTPNSLEQLSVTYEHPDFNYYVSTGI